MSIIFLRTWRISDFYWKWSFYEWEKFISTYEKERKENDFRYLIRKTGRKLSTRIGKWKFVGKDSFQITCRCISVSPVAISHQSSKRDVNSTKVIFALHFQLASYAWSKKILILGKIIGTTKILRKSWDLQKYNSSCVIYCYYCVS